MYPCLAPYIAYKILTYNLHTSTLMACTPTYTVHTHTHTHTHTRPYVLTPQLGSAETESKFSLACFRYCQEFSLACFRYCQKFCFTNFYLLNSFNFVSSKPCFKFLPASGVANAASLLAPRILSPCVSLRNKIGHPAHRQAIDAGSPVE